MKILANALIIVCVFFSLLATAAASKDPPTAVTIHQALEELWSSRRFTEVDAYVTKLENSWHDYVPVQLTLAIYSDQNGGQVEDAVDRLKALHEKLSVNIAVASPVFMELLDSIILRYEKTKYFYFREGISREQRLTERNTLEKTAFNHSKHWVGIDGMLYFNAPEVFVTEQGVIPAYPEETVTPDPELKQKDVSQLLQSISDGKMAIPTRRAAVRELVAKRAAMGIEELTRGLDEANTVYTYGDTIEELVNVGRAAVPRVLEALNDPTSSNSNKRCAIWALVRIGVVDPDVIQTLQTMSSNTDRADLAKYAQDALRHLRAHGKRWEKESPDMGIDGIGVEELPSLNAKETTR